MTSSSTLSIDCARAKGGHYKFYYPLVDEKEYVKYLIETMVESMRRDFPEETLDILKDY